MNYLLELRVVSAKEMRHIRPHLREFSALLHVCSKFFMPSPPEDRVVLRYYSASSTALHPQFLIAYKKLEIITYRHPIKLGETCCSKLDLSPGFFTTEQ